ncbi:MAG: hypothetical protein ACI4TZ_04135 [Christensenellales bacterium]
MKLFNLGIKYMFKNFGYIALLWLLPAVFVGLFCGPFKIIEFMNLYPTTSISNFGDIFAILMPFDWIKLLLVILAVALVAVFLSMVLGEMESHMRSGKFSFKNMFTLVNNDILVVLINIVLLAVIYALLTFIFGCVSFLFHLMFSGLSNIPTVLNSILTIVLATAFISLYTFITQVFLINIPNMITNGYSLKEGISSTMQLIGKSGFKLWISFLLIYVVIIPFVSLLCKTNVVWIANIICTYLQFMLYSSITMTSFFELSNTPRYDNRKYYNYNK